AKYGEIGSGYPSDPKTIAFLKKYLNEHENLPDIVRKSWETSKKLMKSIKYNQQTLM
ncbi:MAG: ribonuclease HII, partial [Candidatus Odinarchaeia archaeon]